MSSLAVKYRPKTFEDVCGQSTTVSILNQMLKVNEIPSALGFFGASGCGKTTIARIVANTMNKGLGHPIEIDAASNNGVDDVRRIIENSKQRSLDSEYKFYIIDECVTGDTEILTSTGFKRFDELTGNEIVAQYDNDGNISFVKPNDFIRMHYNGEMYVWNPRNWCSVRMTPNHVQPLYYPKSNKIRETYAKDVNFHSGNNLIVSGYGVSPNNTLSPLDRIAIMCQADGSMVRATDTYTHWLFSFSKQHKIDRFMKLCVDCGIDFNEIKSIRHNVRRFTLNTPTTITKKLISHFENVDMGYEKAKDFISEVSKWDGSITDNYLYYSSVDKDNADFVSAVSTLAGYSSRVRVENDNRSANYSTTYRVYMYDTMYSNCGAIKKTLHTEYYNGTVYCVKVPTQKIVIRSKGFTFITGNCHSLSNQGWQAFLKLLEEPNKYTKFIFCTTNPEKIPDTIISRIQTFNFTRISDEMIVSRLKVICEKENLILTDDMLSYIARISNGSMRQSITNLEKCTVNQPNPTYTDIVNSIGSSDFTTFSNLYVAIYNNDVKTAIRTVEEVYGQGKDLKLFLCEFLKFLIDLNKATIFGTLDITNLPKVDTIQNLFNLTDKFKVMMDNVLSLYIDSKQTSDIRFLLEAKLIDWCAG